MNCQLCGSDGAGIAYQINKKLAVICGDCWYYEEKIALKKSATRT